MIIGVPREIKTLEFRVGVTPDATAELVKAGHEVLIERAAGEGAGFTDRQYEESGATLVENAEAVYSRAGMIVKVKEPLPPEYHLLREGQILFCYLHLAASEELTRALMDTGVVGIAYETIATEDGRLPLLVPMSQIAGHLSILKGAEHLTRARGGRGALVGSAGGECDSARVLVIGAGVAGSAAARAAAGLGSKVTVLDIDQPRLEKLSATIPQDIVTRISSNEVIREELADADLVVGAVLRRGQKAPYVITRDMLQLMQRHSVIVDVSIDQGGCVETSRPTTHANPVFEVDGVIHYCVANMPGAVPVTATREIVKATLPWIGTIAEAGWEAAMRSHPALAGGLNVCRGKLTCEPVASLFGIPLATVDEVMETAAV